MKITKPFLAGVLIFASVSLVLGVRTVKGNQAGPVPDTWMVPDKTLGNSQAKIRIVEFMDYQCPSCATGSDVLNKFVKNYPDQIFVQVKYFPLSGHAHAYPAAISVECGRQQGRFWEMHDLVFARQADWRDLPDAIQNFMSMAQLLGLDMDAWTSCVTSPTAQATVARDRREGEKLGIQRTPTYFVNGEMIVGYVSLETKLNELLGIKPDPAPTATIHETTPTAPATPAPSTDPTKDKTTG